MNLKEEMQFKSQNCSKMPGGEGVKIKMAEIYKLILICSFYSFSFIFFSDSSYMNNVIMGNMLNMITEGVGGV